MKKGWVAMLVVCVALFAAACAQQSLEDIVHDENFLVIIENNADAENVYGIHIEYYLGEKPIGGVASEIAENTPYQRGEDITLEFDAEAFGKGADLSSLVLEVFVKTGAQEEQLLDQRIEIPAQYGSIYRYSLVGDASGFALRPIE